MFNFLKGIQGISALRFLGALLMLGGAALSAPTLAAPGAAALSTLHQFSAEFGLTPYSTLVQGSDGSFYGTAFEGGHFNKGTVFKISPAGGISTLFHFNGANGSNPAAGVTLTADGTLYGTTRYGGSSNFGTAFKLSPAGVLSTLVHFNGTNGREPLAALTLAGDGSLYGTTKLGGSASKGTAFKISPVGALTTLFHFTGAGSIGAEPYGHLSLAADGTLYGTTLTGGSNGSGTAFKISPMGTFSTLFHFAGGGPSGGPHAGLTLGPDGTLYGTTNGGGVNGHGTAFKISPAGVHTTLFHFNGTNGSQPYATLTLAADGTLYGTTQFGGNTAVGSDKGKGTAFKISPAGALDTLVNFAGTDGRNPYGTLTLTADGSLYGTTLAGGSADTGTVFKISPAGVLSTLVHFNYTIGEQPLAGLTLATDGSLYGTAHRGGSSTLGTVFKISPSGGLSTLVHFDSTNGRSPHSGLTLAGDGSLYGTTVNGGDHGQGTVFRISPAGVLSTLVHFDHNNGSRPSAGLTLAADGSLYGTTDSGGSSNHGTVFKISPAGVLSTLVHFAYGNGSNPLAGLTLAADGSLYGTTVNGGDHGQGTVFKISSAGVLSTLVHFQGTSGATPRGDLILAADGSLYGTTQDGGDSGLGTAFKISPAGVLSTLVNFNGTNNGSLPYAGLTLAADGSLYGTTRDGGSDSFGTVFKISPAGMLSTLVHFNGTNGANPFAGLKMAADGSLYGTTRVGGSSGRGTVFKISLPLTPANLVAAASNARIDLNWNAVPGATQYRIYMATTSNGQNPAVVQLTISNPSASFTSLSAGTTYYFKVTAVGEGGSESDFSNEASALFSLQAPTVTLTATPDSINVDGSSDLTWTSTDATTCTASDGWSGSKALNGSESVAAPATVGNHSYTLTCSGSGGSDSETVSVEVFDTNPESFSFDDKFNVPLDSDQTSNSITVTGISKPAPISISGGEYRIDAGAFTQAPGTVAAGSLVTLRLRSSADFTTTNTATLSIGNQSAGFQVTTLASDVTPLAFFFSDVSGVALGSTQTSNAITVSGINTGAPIQVIGGSYSINGLPFTTSPGTVQDGQQVRVQHVASGLFGTSTQTTLTIGATGVLAGVADTFTSTTLAAGPDTTPDAFGFSSVTNSQPLATVTSNYAVVSGINSPALLQISGGEHQIDGGAWTSAPTSILNGQNVRVRHQTALTPGTVAKTVLTIGGISAAFSSTTLGIKIIATDTQAKVFRFNDRLLVGRNRVYESNTITISGINGPATIAIVGGEYVQNGGTLWSTLPGVALNGDTIKVRHTSAATGNTATNTTLTVGGVSDTYTTTTSP